MISAFSSTSCEAEAAITVTNDMALNKDMQVTDALIMTKSVKGFGDMRTTNENETDKDSYRNNEEQSKEKARDNDRNEKIATDGPLLTHKKTGSCSSPALFVSKSDGEGDGEEAGEIDSELSYFLSSFCPCDRLPDTASTKHRLGDDEELGSLPKPKRPNCGNSIAIQSRGSFKRRKIEENRFNLPLADRIISFPVSIPISSSDDGVWNRNLGDELVFHGETANISRCSTPVALLTPPQSPVTIEMDGVETTMCEWPSNLAVDSAMTTAINEIRPMTPESLQHFEQIEECRVFQPRS